MPLISCSVFFFHFSYLIIRVPSGHLPLHPGHTLPVMSVNKFTAAKKRSILVTETWVHVTEIRRVLPVEFILDCVSNLGLCSLATLDDWISLS